jgi:hypothetical protein
MCYAPVQNVFGTYALSQFSCQHVRLLPNNKGDVDAMIERSTEDILYRSV